MLQLTKDDLGPRPGHRSGITVWQQCPPESRKRRLHVAWDDLILIWPSIRWPDRFSPKPELRRGEEVRVSWVPAMRRIVTGRAPIPNLEAAYEAWRKRGPRIHDLMADRNGMLVLQRDGSEAGVLPTRSVALIEKAFGKPIETLVMKVAQLGSPTLLVGSRHRFLLAIAGLFYAPVNPKS